MKALPLLALLAALPARQEAEKTYELSFKYRPTPGQKIDIIEEDNESRSITITYDDPDAAPDVHVMKRSHSFVAEVEVLHWRGRRDTEMRWVFSKARQLIDGKAVETGLQGGPIRYLMHPKTGLEYSVESGPRLGAAEEKLLDDIVENAFGKVPARASGIVERDPDYALFLSERLRVGQSWKPDPGRFAKAMLPGIDLEPEKTEVVVTLKSVTSRGGGEIARIEGTFTCVILGFGPMKFDTGLAQEATFVMEGCLDGGSVDREFKFTLALKGSTRVKAEGKAPCRGSVDFKREFRYVRKSKP